MLETGRWGRLSQRRSLHATVMAPEIARKMLVAFEEAGTEPSAPALTDRELDVITALARGAGNKRIARTLAISEKSVGNRISNIYKKLHFQDRYGVVLYAIREGLVDAEDGLEGS